jgi:DNA-binding response OmpR family regulator
MSTVVMVEDDVTLAGVVASYLRRAGHDVLHADDGPGGLHLVATGVPDLVLLDVMLPGLSGLSVCAQVRQSQPHLPIIMLTALGETDDRIAGLEVGADDYVTKPFSPRELVLRVESVLRRTAYAPRSGVRLSAAATRDGAPLTLTTREFELLAFLLAHRGIAYSRADLLREVWGWSFGDQSTVTVHVRRLREKIEPDPESPTLIRTVWGVGYRMAEDAEL